jgi:hypothetical protein
VHKIGRCGDRLPPSPKSAAKMPDLASSSKPSHPELTAEQRRLFATHRRATPPTRSPSPIPNRSPFTRKSPHHRARNRGARARAAAGGVEGVQDARSGRARAATPPSRVSLSVAAADSPALHPEIAAPPPLKSREREVDRPPAE